MDKEDRTLYQVADKLDRIIRDLTTSYRTLDTLPTLPVESAESELSNILDNLHTVREACQRALDKLNVEIEREEAA